MESGAEAMALGELTDAASDSGGSQANGNDMGNQYAQLLAKHLVGSYTDHGFAIDKDEARILGGIGLPTVNKNPEPGVQNAIDHIQELLASYGDPYKYPAGLIAIGTVNGPS
jgi:hypothetical protein